MHDDLIIVGGGPAGMLAGLLFARAGARVRVLEKHGDFFRDFRGDTVHPSTMEILDQLGMLGRFLDRPHDRIDHAEIRIAGRNWTIGDLSHINTAAPFIAMMPQWDFLDFLRDEAAAFPGFTLEMNAEVTGFADEGGRITGVMLADGRAFGAPLSLAADGRSSLVRQLDLLPAKSLGAPMDVFWFRLDKQGGAGRALRGSVASGRMVVLIDRRTYWQTAFLVPKGTADAVIAKGIEWIVGEVRAAFPDLSFGPLASLDDLHLLTVTLDRLTRWHRPGLLAIGDAAHAMSPIGGIGINLAIQDAVAAANILSEPLVAGKPVDGLLNRVQAKRLRPTRLVQSVQKAAQDAIIGRVLGGAPISDAPAIVKILDRVPFLRRIPGRLIGLGVGRERVQSPDVRPRRLLSTSPSRD